MSGLELVAALVMLAGLAGVIVPVLPGTPLIFLGALLYDYANNWGALGWGWLLLLFLLMLAAVGGDQVLGHMGARRGGASWLSLAVGFVLSLIGTFLLPPIGFLLGAIVGVIGTELLISRDARQALKAGGGWLVGWVLSLLLQASVALVMLGIVLWQAQ